MSIYSVNQARHLYVVADTAANEGWSAGKDAEGNLFLKFKNADGELLRTDFITNILSAKATKASKMKRELNAVEIAGTPSVSGTYTLGINYRQWIAASDEVMYHEWASANYDGITISAFYRDLAINLAKNTEKQGLVEVKLVKSDDSQEAVSAQSTKATLTNTYKALVIIEKEQDWVLGVKPQTVVYLAKDDIIAPWATVTDLSTGLYVTNGKEVADMEYFFLGERGDQYRNIGWPYVTPTKGRVDDSKEYDLIDIHYAFEGANEGVQKSEKDLTIAVLNSSSTYSSSSLVNAVISAINTAAGSTVITALS